MRRAHTPFMPTPNIGTRTPKASALSWPSSRPTTPIHAPASAATIWTVKRQRHRATDWFRRRVTGEEVQVGHTDLLDPRAVERPGVRPQRRGDTDGEQHHRHAADEELGEAMGPQRDRDRKRDEEHGGAGEVEPDDLRAPGIVGSSSVIRRPSCQGSQCDSQPLRQPVVRELLDRPAAPGAAHRASQRGVVEQSLERARRLAWVVRVRGPSRR